MLGKTKKLLIACFTVLLLIVSCSAVVFAAENENEDSGQVPAYNYEEDTICDAPNK